MIKTKVQHHLEVTDLTADELHQLLDEAAVLKKQHHEKKINKDLEGQTLAMIFDKSSTRTRVSFEAGMTQMGGHAIFLSPEDTQIGRGESAADTARVLSGYVDAVMIRTFSHEMVQEFAAYSSVPVINGLTDIHHPTQVLADLLTIKEQKGTLQGLTAAFTGDGYNNMTHSLMQGMALAGIDFRVACPAGYEPDQTIMENASALAAAHGGSLMITKDPEEAVNGADILITDVWASMGMEAEADTRKKTFMPYQINAELASLAADDYIFMHCLPAHRGEEVTANVIDGAHSVVFNEAENRLHAQKALLKKLMN